MFSTYKKTIVSGSLMKIALTFSSKWTKWGSNEYAYEFKDEVGRTCVVNYIYLAFMRRAWHNCQFLPVILFVTHQMCPLAHDWSKPVT